MVKSESADSPGSPGSRRAASFGAGESPGGSGSAFRSKRRPHSKSRRGCLTCKRRRVKCDENHPRCHNCAHLDLDCSFTASYAQTYVHGPLNMIDLRLFYHYTTVVWKTITAAGISNDQIWGEDVPMLAFEYKFLMRSVLTFAATHLSRTEKGVYENAVTVHRGEALRLLREEVQMVTPQNLDALVAASILLILDALANAAPLAEMSASSLPPSAWMHHVRGAATILLAVGPLPPESKFYSLVNIDLSDLADSNDNTSNNNSNSAGAHSPVELTGISGLQCFDDELSELYPVHTSSPYFRTLVYIDKLFHQRYKSDFILRVFSFPALLDRNLLALLTQGDGLSRKIIKVYYKLVRSFTSEMKDRVWFLEGVSKILPIDTDSDFGGLGFITAALPVSVTLDTVPSALGASPDEDTPHMLERLLAAGRAAQQENDQGNGLQGNGRQNGLQENGSDEDVEEKESGDMDYYAPPS